MESKVLKEYPEGGGSRFFRNFVTYLSVCTASYQKTKLTVTVLGHDFDIYI
jgi:hypothetical protein